MSRDAYRSSAGDLGRNERWDRDRFVMERDRERDRFGGDRERVYEEDDHVYTRGGPPPGPPRRPRPYDDDVVYQTRRRDYYDDEPPRLRRPSPPASRVVFEKEREREVVRSPSPPPLRRPVRPGTLLRRQSSLDTFDRPPRPYYERDREEYGPPARREDFRPPREEFRPPINTPIPLPRSKGLPPPRRYAEREYYDEIKVSDPDYYGDEAFRPAERVREKEVIRTRRRSRSRESRSSRAYSHSRRSRSTSASSSSSDATTTTAKSEYPKKGKTRIPARLVSQRALIDLGYPFVQEGNTIIVQRALGQENIDDLLKLSEDYKKAEFEVSASRSSAGDILEERHQEVVIYPGGGAPLPPPPPPQVTFAPPPQPTYAPAPTGPPPMIVNAAPPQQQQQPVEYTTTTRVVRDVSPARTVSSYTTGTSYDTYTTDTAYAQQQPYVMNAQPQYPTYNNNQQMAMVPVHTTTTAVDKRHRSRSRHHGGRHSSRDLVSAERLPTGELVLFEETVERVEEPNRGVRVEKDKRGPPPKLMRAMLATLT
ncbi:hypothetical protein CONLIGDRAFT_100929 [Coniochaeta ligniaria NRRL 30616]|uniref:DUF8035 domain-containing protein n=1 Tax=Coniochaeta ligniaria NRRL 30616 TaxID=1408157 RepID=A0A1J7IAY2_9PEZI|nr:hypothetical protein CONLIGDRAFT_100929 [Coniochaeta ligniaria NRRL 30616]